MAHEHPPLNQSIYLPYWHFSILYTYILQEKSHFNACIPCIYKITVKSLLTLKQNISRLLHTRLEYSNLNF